MSGSTINTTIDTPVTLGSGGYQSTLVITNIGEINVTSAPSSTDGAQGAFAVYGLTTLGSGLVQNAGTLIGGTGYINGGDGVYLYGYDDRVLNTGLINGGYSTDAAPGGRGGAGIYLAAEGGISVTNAGTVAGGNGDATGGNGLVMGSKVNLEIYPQFFSVNSPRAPVVYNNGLILGGRGEKRSISPGPIETFTVGGYGGLGVFLGEGTLINTGTIIGGSGVLDGGYGVSVFGTLGGTLINSGTIIGGAGAGGTIADAVLFDAATIASTLVVEPGAVFIGDVSVQGSAPDVLALGAANPDMTGTLNMGGSFSGFSTISFESGGVWHLSGDIAELANGVVIDGFTGPDALFVSDFTTSTYEYAPGVGLEISNGSVTETIDITGSFSHGSLQVMDTAQGTEVSLCYLRGTRIATPAGEVPVERLTIGDAVVTRFGGYRRIKWIGRQSFGARFIRANRGKIPVRIAAGALGGGLPRRDLFVSPGHALLLNGVLVLARDLINDVTVAQTLCTDDVHYYQIEFETHDCVMAEGAWAESFCDYADLRGEFHNAAEFWVLYPEHVTPAEHLLCAPRPVAGPALAAALWPVVTRAAASVMPGPLRGSIDEISPGGLIRGWAQDVSFPTLPIILEILCGTHRLGTVLACDYRPDLEAAGIGTGRAAFTFQGPRLRKAQRANILIRRSADGALLAAGTKCNGVITSSVA